MVTLLHLAVKYKKANLLLLLANSSFIDQNP